MKKLLFTILMISSFIGVGQENQEYLKYFNSGQSKFESGDFYGAIYEYTKAIEVLDEKNPLNFTFKNNYIAWKEYATPATEIKMLRMLSYI